MSRTDGRGRSAWLVIVLALGFAVLAQAASAAPRPGYSTGPVQQTCGDRFCVHWVETTADAPALADGTDDGDTPDYVDAVAAAFDASAGVLNDQLGWRAPVDDGDGLTDVYVKALGASDGGHAAYAASDDGQTGRRQAGFAVVDNDFGGSAAALQAASAHEYMHLLELGYDALQDRWMEESTATWAEEKVFPAANAWHGQLAGWASDALSPLSGRPFEMAAWNHWLEANRGADVVRNAWASSTVSTSRGFAPSAYDRAIRAAHGWSFGSELAAFAATTAEWTGSGTGIPDGGAFPSVPRQGSLTLDGPSAAIQLDHLSYALFDLPRPNVPSMFVADVMVGTSENYLALILRKRDHLGIGLKGGSTNGWGMQRIDNPAQYNRITAVLLNGSLTHGAYDAAREDWAWTRDGKCGALRVTGPGVPITLPEGCDVPANWPQTIPVDGRGTVPRHGQVGPALAVTAGAQPRMRTIARRGRLQVRAKVNGAGRLRARATVARKVARRLGLGKSRATIAAARRTARSSGTVRVNLRLTKRARTALKRQKRPVRVSVALTFTPSGGGSAQASALSLKLKP